MSSIEVISWNILAEAMVGALKCLPEAYSPEKRREQQKEELKVLIEKHPNAIIAVQEFDENAKTNLCPVLKEYGYEIIFGEPSKFTTTEGDEKFWRERRKNMTTALFIPKGVEYEQSGVFNLAAMVPEQNDDFSFPLFIDNKGNTTKKTILEELMGRISLLSTAVVIMGDKRIVIGAVHIPCVWYLPCFQALVFKAINAIELFLLRAFNADAFILVGDWNISHVNLKTRESEVLWEEIVNGTESSYLPDFKGANLKVIGYHQPPLEFVSSCNGSFETTITHCKVSKNYIRTTTCAVKGAAVDESEKGMSESGPSDKYSSDHIPMLYIVDFE
jgi:hypothetical protein